MALGAMLRNLVFEAHDTVTDQHDTYTIITDGPGQWADWSQGSYQGGMGIPGAWSASLLLAELIGTVPWYGYREAVAAAGYGPGRGPLDGLDPDDIESGEAAELAALYPGETTPPGVLGPAFRRPPGSSSTSSLPPRRERIMPPLPLVEQPHPPDPRVVTFTAWALDLIWHGNAVGIIAARDELGRPTAVLPVPARTVGVDRVGRNTPSDLPVGAIRYYVGGRWWPASAVVHIKGPCEPGALRGFGVLENHLNGALRLARELGRQAGNLHLSGVPTGVLKSLNPDLTGPEATELKTTWTNAQRDRTVAVLNATTEYEPLGWKPTDTQLIEAREFSLHELALIFKLDPSWLGVAGASQVYANLTENTANLLRFSLGGHLARFEQTLTLALPPGEGIAADLDTLLRPTPLQRFQTHELAVTVGIKTRNEARAEEGLEPLPGGDELPPMPALGGGSAGGSGGAGAAGGRSTSGPQSGGSGISSSSSTSGDREHVVDPVELLGLHERAEADALRESMRADNSEALHRYWTAGPGLARWSTSRTPWRTLVGFLSKYIPNRKNAEATAASWYRDVFGVLPQDN